MAFDFLAREVVELGRFPHRRNPTPQEDAIVAQAMQATHVGHLAQRNVNTLSGGEKARVQLARSLAQIWEPRPDGADRWLFLDEPTVEVMNHIAIDFNAVGNHEFDRGWRELLRLQHGGCEQFTARAPCQISQPFTGARFGFLAANVQREDGKPLLAATGTKRFTQGGVSVTVGFIGSHQDFCSVIYLWNSACCQKEH